MSRLDSLTRTLKGNKHWLVVKPNNNHLQGSITRVINTTHKANILKHLGGFIQDTEDYEIIISAISKIVDHFMAMFPQGIPLASIDDQANLQGLVTQPGNPNNVTVESFIYARLKRNVVNGVVIKVKDGALASYSSGDHTVNVNVEGIQNSISRNIANNGKYNYRSTDDYVYCEFEKSIIHEFLHALSDSTNQIGFANYNSSTPHIGMNEATTEKIASMIASPSNYRKTNLTILKTRRSQFLTNIDSNSGYSFYGIVNLVGMLTGIEKDNTTIQGQYILGRPIEKILPQSIVDIIDKIYDFAKEKNPIQQANSFYSDSMKMYYDAIGITDTSKPTTTKTVYIDYVDDRNIKHTIPATCHIYPGDVYKYDIPSSSVISDEMVDGTFAENHIKNQKAGQYGAKSAVAKYITGYLNTNNISPYAKTISVSHTDIQGQSATWRYLMASRAQDDISSRLFSGIAADIKALQTNFSVSKFQEILKRIDAIGDNIVYAIPNSFTKYNLNNVGYVSRLVNSKGSTLPLKTISEYHILRQDLLATAKAHESQFTPKTAGKEVIINLDGCDIAFEKTTGGYVLAKKQSNLIALLDKIKKYPMLTTVPNIDPKYLCHLVEEIVNNGLAFNDLDEFSSRYIQKPQVTYQTMCSYLRNEKFKQKDYILTANINFEYNSESITKFIPIKVTTEDKDKLHLTRTTLQEIQAKLKTPYALSELNALVSIFVLPRINSNISDFSINCNFESPQLKKALNDSKKDRYIRVDGVTYVVPVVIAQDTCIIMPDNSGKLDKHIEKYLTTSKHITMYNSVPNKRKLIEIIRRDFNHYIHSTGLNDALRTSTKSKPLNIDITKMVDYIVTNSPNVARELSAKKPTPKPTPKPAPKPRPNPSGNQTGSKTGTNPSGDQGGNKPNGQIKLVSPYDYFKNYIDKNGNFTFTPYTAWQNTAMNAQYYAMMYQQYQFMQYYSYMMNFYGGYQNYPMIQQMNMGSIMMPGSIMYGGMPQMSMPMMMPYVFNGYNNFYGYNSYMQGGFNPQVMPFYQNGQNGITPCTIQKSQIDALSQMVTNLPTNPSNVVETVKALQDLKAKLDALIAANSETLKKVETPTSAPSSENSDLSM